MRKFEDDLMDPRDKLEASQAFADDTSKGELTVGSASMMPAVTIADGIITAQRVEVERDDAKVLRKIATLAAVAGEDWFYRFPVKKRGGGQDFIEGPSIKCANNVARAYGNCQVDTRVMDSPTAWIIYARFVDYETGFSLTRPFQQDKNASRMGGADDARRKDIAFQIGVSKAIRNVVCNALETFTTFAFEEAQKNLVGRIGKDLPTYKERVLGRLKEMGIDIKRVELVTGRTVDAWLAPDVARIVAEIKAVNDGMATADETWPPPPPPEPTRAGAKAETEKKPAAAKVEPKKAEPKKPDPEPEPEGWPLHDEVGDTVGRFASSDWARRVLDASTKLEGKELASFLENNGDTAKQIWEGKETVGALSIALQALYTPDEAAADPVDEKSAADYWHLGDGVLGEPNIIKAIKEMIDGDAVTEPADVENILKQNQDRIGKMSAMKRDDIARHAETRYTALQKAAA